MLTRIGVVVLMIPALVGCAAIPIVGGIGGAVVAKVGEKAIFPAANEAIWAYSLAEIQEATFVALRKLGVAKVTVEEWEGGKRTVLAAIDGRDVSVAIEPSTDGPLTRVRVRAKAESSLAPDDALQRAIIEQIGAELRSVEARRGKRQTARSE